jgi:chromate transport protein ChrA
MDQGQIFPVFLLRVVIITLAAILAAVVLVMLYGLFDTKVDNKEIFSIVGPAFQTIVGCFVGLLGGHALRANDKGS